MPDDDPREEDYSACADPGKYGMVVDRCEAWAEVLEERGWAGVTRERMDGEDWSITLRPARDGALPLRLRGAAWIFDSGRAPMVEVEMGEERVPVGQQPDCACDACDRGSEGVLQSLDQAVFPVIDGSFRITARQGETWVETPFGGHTREPAPPMQGEP